MSDPKPEAEPPKPAPAPTPRKKLTKVAPPKPPEPPPPPSFFVRLARAPALWATVWPLVFVIGTYLLWQNWGRERVGQEFYKLEPNLVRLNSPPEYVTQDIVANVFRTHQLDKLSLLDRNATVMISEALRTSPWVADVMRVEKASDGIVAQVRYRQPIATVRVISRHEAVEGQGLFFVDNEAMLLPTEGFREADVRNYLQIEVENTYPSGNRFSDIRVVAACEIAALLAEHRTTCDLVAIRLTNPMRTFNEPWLFVLIRANGSQVVWGSPPGEELDGEMAAAAKVTRLLSAPAEVSDLRN